jgi:hypothetical protein
VVFKQRAKVQRNYFALQNSERVSQQKLIWLLGSSHTDRKSFDYSEEYDAQIA